MSILNHTVNDFLDMDNNDILKENSGKKFDIVLMNPPYEGELHIKFLIKVLEISNKVINISPIDWMLRTPNYFKNKGQFYKYYDKLKSNYADIEQLSLDDNFKYFNNARISNILAIQSLNHEDNNLLDEITINSKEANICKKIFEFSKKDNIDNHLEKNKKDGFRVKFGRIGGGNWTARKPHSFDAFKEIVIDGLLKDGRPHWKMCSVNQYTKKTETMAESLKFDNEKDANDFINIYKTKIMQYYIAFMHQDMHIHPEYMPYFNKNQLYFRDKELCKYFNISGYISDNKAEKDSEWETVINLWNEYNKE